MATPTVCSRTARALRMHTVSATSLLHRHVVGCIAQQTCYWLLTTYPVRYPEKVSVGCLKVRTAFPKRYPCQPPTPLRALKSRRYPEINLRCLQLLGEWVPAILLSGGLSRSKTTKRDGVWKVFHQYAVYVRTWAAQPPWVDLHDRRALIARCPGLKYGFHTYIQADRQGAPTHAQLWSACYFGTNVH